MQWRLTSPGREYNRDEGLVVYFHPASGNTHLINDLAASVLRVLASASQSEQDLLACHAGALSELDITEQATVVDDLLRQLEAIDLVEPA